MPSHFDRISSASSPVRQGQSKPGSECPDACVDGYKLCPLCIYVHTNGSLPRHPARPDLSKRGVLEAGNGFIMGRAKGSLVPTEYGFSPPLRASDKKDVGQK